MVRIDIPGIGIAYRTRYIKDFPKHLRVEYDTKLLKKFAKFFIKYKSSRVDMFKGGTVITFYTNSVPRLNEIHRICDSLVVNESVSPPDNTMYFFREPKFKHRVYFKGRRVSDETKESLRAFVKNNENSDTILISHGIHSFLNMSLTRYINAGCHVDFNDESMLSYLCLMFSECIGKQYVLEKRP